MAKKTGDLSAREAAQKVLSRARGPLHQSVVVERVMAMDGISLGGATPEATITHMLAIENKKENGWFTRVSPGTYTTREKAATKASTPRLARERQKTAAPVAKRTRIRETAKAA